MRTIKFRGKVLNSDQWICGDLLSLSTDNKIRLSGNIENYGSGIMILIVNPETVGQFTGLTDKTGREIFEGDRILYSSSIERGEGVITFNRGFNIEWDLQTVVSTNPTIISPLFYFGCSSEIEIIGNIHDQKS